VLIAQLMLQPADVLLLDEPTNDLDIPTLEILEEACSNMAGRWCWSRTIDSCWTASQPWFLDSMVVEARSVLLIIRNGKRGSARSCPWLPEVSKRRPRPRPARDEVPHAVAKKKLSYTEAREFAAMESRINEAEQILTPSAPHSKILQSPAIE